MRFHNSWPYPVDVFWLPCNEKEELYKSNLEYGEEYDQHTYFDDEWIFKQSNTNIRLLAGANGLTEDIFEGNGFGAQINSVIRVEIVGFQVEGNARFNMLSICVIQS